MLTRYCDDSIVMKNSKVSATLSWHFDVKKNDEDEGKQSK